MTDQEENSAGKQSVSLRNIGRHSKSAIVKTIFTKSAFVKVANSKNFFVKNPLVQSSLHQPYCDWDAE